MMVILCCHHLPWVLVVVGRVNDSTSVVDYAIYEVIDPWVIRGKDIVVEQDRRRPNTVENHGCLRYGIIRWGINQAPSCDTAIKTS